MKNTNKQNEMIDFLNSLDIDIDLSCIYSEDDSFESYIDKAYDLINEYEVIYYFNAINYLKDEDPSLKESFELASEYGYNIENLSSEILATILKQERLRESLSTLSDEIEEFFEVNN